MENYILCAHIIIVILEIFVTFLLQQVGTVLKWDAIRLYSIMINSEEAAVWKMDFNTFLPSFFCLCDSTTAAALLFTEPPADGD